MVEVGDAQSIASVAHSIASLGKRCDGFFSAVATKETANYLATEGSPQAMSTVLWSFSKMGYAAGPLATTMDRPEVVEYFTSHASPQAIASSVCR